MEIIESFSTLFDGLIISLETDRKINYTTESVTSQCALGMILSRVPSYKPYLIKKTKDQSKEKRKKIRQKIQKPLKTPDFDTLVKKIQKLAEISTAFFARYQRNIIRTSLEKTRKWVFKAILSLAKEKIFCTIQMKSSQLNFEKKLKEFSEDYSWKKFFHYLQVISLGLAKISEKKIAKDMKEKIEQYVKRPVKISRFVCIENLYCNEAAHEKKTQKKLSNYSKDNIGKSFSDVPNLFSSFLTLQNTSDSIVRNPKDYNKSVLLSRSSIDYLVISHMFSPVWKPYSLHFYYDQGNSLQDNFIQEYSAEDSYPSGSIELKSIKYTEKSYEVDINSSKYTLKFASLSELLNSICLYYIDIPRFDLSPKYIIKSVSPSQKQELLRIYTTNNSPILYPEIIPETDIYNFSHEYILINNTQSSRIGNGSRNWIVQLQKDFENKNEVCVCAWNGCLAPKALHPVNFKVLSMAKTRKKIKKITGNDLCRLHQCINLAIGAKKGQIAGSELWSAVQGGILWQNKIKATSNFHKIITNKVPDLLKDHLDPKNLGLSKYKSEKQLKIEKIISDPEGYKKLKKATLKEILELKKTKEYESAATEELKKISEYSNVLNNVRFI
jgi:hypothetical protein